jgi:hypothetical protein
MSRNNIHIPLPEEEALRLAFKVKPTKDMPRPGANPQKKAVKKKRHKQPDNDDNPTLEEQVEDADYFLASESLSHSEDSHILLVHRSSARTIPVGYLWICRIPRQLKSPQDHQTVQNGRENMNVCWSRRRKDGQQLLHAQNVDTLMHTISRMFEPIFTSARTKSKALIQ